MTYLDKTFSPNNNEEKFNKKDEGLNEYGYVIDSRKKHLGLIG